MPDPHVTPDRAANQTVWLVYVDDLSHGIQSIVGIFSNMAAAEKAASVCEGDVVVENWPVEDD
jgi:hypothetical protein